MSSTAPLSQGAARKNTPRAPSFASFKPSATQQPIVVITEPDNVSDTPTEVEYYTPSANKAGQSSRARPGPQRAILEIASTMDTEDIAHVIEMLSLSLKESVGQKAQQPRLSPRGQTQAQVQPRRSKSGPPLLSHGHFMTANDEDIEVQRHNHANETYRLIPPVSSVPHSSHTRSRSTTPIHFRLSSSTPNGSPDMQPVDCFKKSPVPSQYCPTVDRKIDNHSDLSSPCAWPVNTSTIPTASADVHVIGQDTFRSNTQPRPCVPPLDLPSLPPRNRSYESIHSPRSAFDDCSVGSSNSAFTESSRRSSLTKDASRCVTAV